MLEFQNKVMANLMTTGHGILTYGGLICANSSKWIVMTYWNVSEWKIAGLFLCINCTG
jgi:hypothetical protein